MFLTDAMIADLIGELKPAIDARDLLKRLQDATPDRGHRRSSVTVTGISTTNVFALHLRQSSLDAFDFSVILTLVTSRADPVNLRRHNGLGHAHRNALDGTRFQNAFHVHMATEAYQVAGHPIDGYAEPTDTYADVATALDEMLRVASFEPPAQMTLAPQ